LYTNDEEVQIKAARPIILNGIPGEMVSRPDLMDRALMIELPIISDTDRRTEEEVWRQIQQASPEMFGVLLDAVSAGLRNLPTVQLPRLPRLADFIRWGEACGPMFGWPRGQFLADYEWHRADLDGQALGTWSVGSVLFCLLRKRAVVEGTVAEVLHQLNEERRGGVDRGLPPDWPRSPRGLAAELKRYKPALHRYGVEVESLNRTGAGRRVRIWRTPAFAH
jgi:hypothetical protein